MPKSAVPERRGWLAPVLALIAGVVALRLALLALARADVFVDEAQYWLWGQELAFGYYSKPPMIGWLIRAATDLAGSDAPFWLRAPGAVCHGITALILAGTAARLSGPRTALVVAAGYLSLPMVTVGSLLISTDTVMAPFLAGALALWLMALERGEARHGAFAGALLGLAFLSKYAAVYYLLGAGIAAIVLPSARPRAMVALAGAAAFIVVISPNILWNAVNGFTTVQHTLDNADWVRNPGVSAGLNFDRLAEFFLSQFAVFGPVPFAVLLLAAAGIAGRDAPRRGLILWIAVPIIVLVCTQALLSRAYANWAASAYLAGALLVFPLLLRHRVWLWLSFAINGALALALPIAATQADRLVINERHVFERYLGRADLSTRIIAAAQGAGLDTVVSDNRDILADLFYTGRDAGLTYYALPPTGRAPHHYALRFPYPPGGTAPVALVTLAGAGPDCDVAPEELAQITPETGAYRRRSIVVLRVEAACLAP